MIGEGEALAVVCPAELHRALAEWNDTASGFPPRAIHRLFEEQAAVRPGALAVIWEGGELTYSALDRRAGQIARALARLGVGREDRVGLAVERSGEMVAAVLGILKAGGAYLPIDSSYPRERLELLLTDAAPAAIVGSRRLLAGLPGTTPRLVLEDLAEDRSDSDEDAEATAGVEVAPEGLAYVLYTSGSTGVPKGVEVNHQAVVRLVRATGYAAFGPGEVFLQLAPMSFDAATLELWGPLLNGGRLALFPPRPFSLAELDAAVERYGVTTLWLTAGLFHLAVEAGLVGLAGLRQLLAGGDVLSRSHVERALAALPGVELINGYGPTENTTFSCTYRLREGLGEGSVPIGRPISGSRAYVLDDDLALAAVGAEGELYVGGAGLARGYLGRAELTAERFVPDPFAAAGGGRLYRTGDLARWRPDGILEFLGRRDFQVKVRGFRIEPGEIESALLRHPGVLEAVVVAVADAAHAARDHRLVAYYVPAEDGAGAAELRGFLRERLPEYLVPAAFVRLGALPLTPSGKVDRRALPAPEAALHEGDEAVAAPRTAIEAEIAGLFAEVLGVGEPGRIGIEDDFFDRGGHSLSATRLVSRLRQVYGVELGLLTLFEAPTVAGLARQVEAALGAGTGPAASQALSASSIVPVARGGTLPLSFAQQRLWFLDRLAPDRPTYNIPSAYELRGRLVPAALAAGLTALVERHEALRTRFVEVDGEPRQEILEPSPFPLPSIDLGALPRGDRQGQDLQAAELARIAAGEARRPFDLARGPLLRGVLVAMAGEERVLLLTLHHIVYDGWSEGVLLAELPTLYAAQVTPAGSGRPLASSALAALPVQYADFAAWQRAWPPEVLAGQLDYWRRQLAGAPAALPLPTDRPRPAVQSFRGASRTLLLPAETAARLHQAARREGATLYMLLLAGFAALLSRYSGQENLLIGTPVANRTRPEIEGLIGFFVNTLVLRVQPEGDPDFRRLLRDSRATALGAFAHQDLPFEVLVEELRPERDLARNPLIQVMLALQSAGATAFLPPALVAAVGEEAGPRFTPLRIAGTLAAMFDLALLAEEEPAGLALTLEYATDLFTAATAARLLEHYATLLAGAAAAPDLPLSRLPLLSAAERHQALAEWSDTAAGLRLPAGAGSAVHQLVAEQARLRPAAPAVVDGARTLRYGDLDRQARRLAAALRGLGVGPEVRVGVCLERSPELVASVLAVLQAGGAYVALDPAHPEDRLRFQLADSRVPVLLTRRGRLAELAAELGIRCLFPHDPETQAATFADLEISAPHPDQLAYVIYTSGSTGRPKGVEISHRSLSNLVAWHLRAFAVTAADRATLLSGVGFDAAVWETWPYLASGASLHVPPEALRTAPEALREWLVAEGITMSFLPVALAEAVLDGWDLAAPTSRGSALRYLLTGADQLHRRPQEGAPFALVNDYGPTEGTVVTTAGRVLPGDGYGQAPTLGRPIDNVRVHVADSAGGLAPAGVPGELRVGGAGLARGYLGRPDLTAEHFVPDPFAIAAGERLYRTGDLVRFLPDGELDFLGRIDHQVKIRGFRVELGEIEAVLSRHRAVREVAVLALDGNLVAFFAAAAAAHVANTVEVAELRETARRELPAYMVPARFLPLAALPLSASGKVDRQALALLARQEIQEIPTTAGPRTPVEEQIGSLWEEVLGRSPIQTDDNFFELGGHSLLVTRVLSRIRQALGVDLPVQALFEFPTVAQLARVVRSAREAAERVLLPPLVPVPRGGRLPLSLPQQRLWLLDRLAPESPAYNIPAAYALSGPLKPAALAASLAEIVRRHEALRTRFVEVDGLPWQEILAPAPIPVPLVDLSGLGGLGLERLQAAELARLRAEETLLPFDLGRGPLPRARLVRRAAADHVLLLTLHHIVSDGWSDRVLFGELSALYAVAGRPSPLPELPIQYADFAVWQRAWPEEVLAGQLDYWRRQLAGAPAALELPTDRPRPAAQSFRGDRRELLLGAELSALLRQTARQEGATLYMLLLAGFAALLSRYSGQEDLLIGAPVANRTRPEIEGLIGFFVNTLALRARLAGDPDFRQLVAAARETALGAFAHQDLPFEALVEELRPERDLARNPLVQVTLALNAAGPAAVTGSALRLTPLGFGEGATAKFDLSLAVEERGAELALDLEYATDLFTGATAARFLSHYEALLTAAVREPGSRVSRLPLLTAAERQQLAEWNDTVDSGGSVGSCGCLHELIEAQVRRTPEAVAIVAEDESLTFHTLNARANRLARHLRGLGVLPGTVVAIAVERSATLMVGLLAILKAGGAYLPLDPDYPQERLRFMLADSGAPVVLTVSGLVGRLGEPKAAVLCLDDSAAPWRDRRHRRPGSNDDLPNAVRPEDLAYVIYTSGSTGRPKGTMNSHRGIVNRLLWMQERQGLRADDRLLQKTLASFDVSVPELFWPLLTGACLVMARPGGHRDPGYLLETLAEQEITTVHFVPAMLRAFLDALSALDAETGPGRTAGLGALRRVFASGEALSYDLQQAYQAALGAPLFNLYGPTEAAVEVTYWACEPAGPRRLVPIGRPVANTRIHLLDREGQEVPIGVPGELHIGGVQLARGYLDRPGLTAGAFVPDPFAEPGARLYRTGDLARWLPDGAVDYLGRTDHQVKIRGFRIELGEIESVLLRHPEVREAVVVALAGPGGDSRLVAYVVAVGEAVAAADLRAYLGERVPEHMVPAAFVGLPALPLTPSGKVDRKALPAPEAIASEEGGEATVAPRTPIEEAVAGIWRELLGGADGRRIGVHDNFFHLGGHSLLATRTLSRLRQTLGVELPLRAVFEAPTVAGMARRVEAALRTAEADFAPPPIGRVARDRPLPLSFAQQRLWFLDRLEPGGTGYNIPAAYELSGPFTPAALAVSLEEIVRRHEVLRTRLVEVDGLPWQEILAPRPVVLPLSDLGRLPLERRDSELARLAREEAGRPFDLARGPLWRAGLVRLAAEEHRLLLTLHHIVSDGWSDLVLSGELAALYAAALDRRPSPLPELPVQYADFAAWQRSWPEEVLAGQLAYWRRQLAGAPSVLALPTDRLRPATQSFRGASRTRLLPAELAAALRQVARREGATLYMLLLAGFAALLGRHSGQDDLLIGTPVANRTRPEVEGLIGFFVNTLALRTRLDGDLDFRGLLAAARETALGAFAHQDLPFEALVEELRQERDLARNPLVQVMLTLQSAGQEGARTASMAAMAAEPHSTLRFTPLRLAEHTTAKFDLSLAVEEPGGELALELEYATDLFGAATAARLLEHFAALLSGAVRDPGCRVARLPLLAAAERQQLWAEWNDTASGFPRRSIHRLFEEQAAARPATLAVVWEGGELTYGDLDRRAGQIARALARLGVGREDRVGLVAERSGEMVPAVLGILKAGGAYLPIDPSYPRERLELLLADAAPAAVVGSRRQLEALPGTAPRLVLEDLVDDGPDEDAEATAGVEVAPEGLAYVLYTSGSTGVPKGVEVSHQAVVRLVRETGYAAFGPGEVYLQLAPMSFDAATLELWGPLLNGGRLALFPPRPFSLAELDAAVERYGVTTLWLTAGLFHLAVEAGLAGLAGLHQLLAGGDALSPSHVERALAALPGVELINGYGPTENTTFSCTYRLREGLGEGSVPIGRPIAGSRAYVLDRNLELAPLGVVGELYVGGAGVARGYLGLPELTAERFVPEPLPETAGGRLYRTGDLVRRRPDGLLEFLGRRDFQVKVRGFRIEPGEVESALLLHPGVRQAVVVALAEGAGDHRLVAYYAADASVEPAELRSYLRERLPEPMVPSAFVALPALPLTVNGKVDRRALPAPEEALAAGTSEETVAPRTPAEELVADLWIEALGLSGRRFGVHENFFHLGGHSLLATRVVSRLRQTFGVELPLRAVFEAPTVAGLARRVEAALRADAGFSAPPLLQRDRNAWRGRLPLSLPQQRLWFLDRLAPGSPAYNIPTALEISGPLAPAALAAGLTEIVRRHESLRTRFVEADGLPWQEILAPWSCPLPRIDLDGLPRERRGPELVRLARGEAVHSFDLAQGPLLRARLVRQGEEEHALLLTLHHIVSDGWSDRVLVGELAALYPAAVEGRPSPLPELPIQYADFAAWQHSWPGGMLAEQLAYWAGQLAGAPTALDLPTDRPRPAVQSFNGASRELRLPAETAAGLRQAARREGVTLYMVLLAGFAALLSRYSGQEDLLIGAPVASRTRPEVEGLIGFFVNTLALRARLTGDPELRQLLLAVRETALGAFAHQDLPFETLVEELRPERDLGRNPLVQVTLALETAGVERPGAPGIAPAAVRFTPVALGESATAKFDLSLAVWDQGTELALGLEYAADLFSAATAARLLRHYGALLTGIVQDHSGCRVSQLPLLSAPERQQLGAEWNDTRSRFPRAVLHRRIEEQVRRTPAALAVVGEDESLTFRALNARSNRLARHLQTLGVGPETMVAIAVERSAAMMVGLLAILKAGGAYLPLDPDSPQDRLQYMLEDSGASVLLTESGLVARLAESAATALCLDDPQAPWAEERPGADAENDDLPDLALPDNLAYVIYTSGSTGRPKGTMNSHRGIVNRLLWMQEQYGLTADDRVLQKTPFSFDVSVWELFWPLLSGARLVMARPGGHRDPAYLLQTIEEQGITTLHFVPAMLRVFLEGAGLVPERHLRGVRRVMASGEALPFDLQQQYYSAIEAPLYNLYGPTEAAVDVTHWECDPAADRRLVPIGRPVANTRIHLLDRQEQEVPIGVPGELHIGGVQLARGYLGRPDLTAEKFVPDPFAAQLGGEPGARLYRTGDVARYLPDGAVDYLGRSDHQVKIRGFRIELGEIEAALARHPAVREAVVTLFEGPGATDRRLAAYVVPDARRAAPLLHQERMEHAGLLAGRTLYELPNGMAVAHQNRGETDFLYDEIFVQEGYLKHGIRLAEGATVFDVGANIGLFTLFAGRLLADVTIYAFEPIPPVFEALRINAQLYGLNARLFDCGLSDTPGMAEFTYYPNVTLISGRFADATEERDVVRSFLRNQQQAGEISEEQVEDLLGARLQAQRVSARLRTLSEVIAEEGVLRIDLLKVDVEKAEREVLAGLREEDWAKVQQVVIEVHDIAGRLAEMTGLLHRHGFEVVVEQDTALEKTVLYNLYARRPELPADLPGYTRPVPAAERVWSRRETLVAELRQELKESLPDYMVPAAFVVLPTLPLTPSGKVDRKVLPPPEETLASAGDRGTEVVAPRTPLEEVIAGIWEEVLGFAPPRGTPSAAGRRIGSDDNFFELGGHSLLVTRVLSRLRQILGVALPVQRMFESPTLRALARLVTTARQVAEEIVLPPLVPVPRGGLLPLSFPQQRLWFLDRLTPGSPAYNIPAALALHGPVDAAILAACLAEIVRRQEVLRTRFVEVDGEPWQEILPPRPVLLPFVDLGRLGLDGRAGRLQAAEVERLGREEAGRPFELARGPLLRAGLLRLSSQRHALLLTLHHIVSDGWSTGVLLGELWTIYAAVVAGRPSPLAELPVQYGDFAAWQRAWPREVLERQLAYWKGRLASPATLEVPTDRPRPPVQTFHGRLEPLAVPPALTALLRGLARDRRVTLFMAALAAWQALFHRITGQDDVAIGSPVANRTHRELEGMVGFFVNLLALRVDCGGDPSYAELLDRVRPVALEAYDHADLPFERLVDELSLGRDLSRPPLVQVMFQLESMPPAPPAAPAQAPAGLAPTPLELAGAVAKFDLTLSLLDRGDDLLGEIEYSTALFDRVTVVRLAGHFVNLLAALAAEPEARLSGLARLAPAERHQLLSEWNDTPAPFPEATLLHRFFAAAAERSPGALAAISAGEEVTYAELAVRANRLGHLLREQGLPRGGAVGVWMERSLDMLVAVLGILEAGGYYLPLDASWPVDRVESILAATGARAVVAGPGMLAAVEEIRWRLPALADAVCLALSTPEPPVEPIDPESVRGLFDFVAERAVDRVTASGFVSSFTGLPFAEAEVDEYRDRVLSLAAPWLRPDSRVLEIGSGSGLLLWEMARRVGHAVGIDPSPRTQERNRAHLAAEGIENVELSTGFAHELDQLLPAGARFDLVLLASTVQFFPGPRYLERVVAAALDRLAPGGVLLVADVLDARRRGELREASEAHRGRSAVAASPLRGRELYLDEDLFRDLAAALPGAGAITVHHRLKGFANELGFRYDVLLHRPDGDGLAADAANAANTANASVGRRRKRLWTGCHVAQRPSGRLAAVASPEDIAYVIHTSGSTGEPKGIVVQHRPAANLIDWINRTFGVGAGDRALFITSLSFDLSVYDIFGVLAAGGTVHVASEEELADPDRLVSLLRTGGITLWDSAPAALVRLAPLFPEAPDRGSGLRLVLLSGDWIPVTLPDRVRRAFPAARVMALGGATEATVWSNWFPVGEVDPAWPSIPYGRPIANARYHVLDAGLEPCPIGVPGDLYIGGDCLCSGYARRPDLTAPSFLPDPFASQAGARLYRTGDRVRHFADGNLEFLGRLDQQVKVRGYRIELGEIEVALARCPGVREAVVLARPAREGAVDDLRLVAYVVPVALATPAGGASTAPTGQELREQLRRALPEYMVPAAFVFLDALPVTPNGKLDRKALPDPRREDGAEGGEARVVMAPRTPLEERLASLWSEVLGIDPVGGIGGIGVEDNFFELGGHSLLATQLVARIRHALGVEVPLRTLFQRPTLADLALAIAEMQGAAGAADTVPASPIVPVPREGELPLSYSQLRQWFLVQLDPGSTAYDVPITLRLAGFLEYEPLARSIDEIVRRHEALRSTFTVVGGRPSVVIATRLTLPLALIDLAGLPAAERGAEGRRLVQAQGKQVFDLARGPLLHVSLARLSPDEHLLLLTVHHIVFDGWSLGVFTRELAALYPAFRDGRPSPLPELEVQYVDYAAWQRRWLAGEDGRQQLEYWRGRLAGAAKMLHLPTDRPRPAAQTYNGAFEPIRLPATLAEQVQSLGRAAGATLFMTLLTGLYGLLQRYTRQDDINVGTFVANRRWQAVEPLVGFFINTLVLRTGLDGGPSFHDLLARVRETTLGAYEHQDIPFEMLLEELAAERDLSRTPLFQVMFGVQNFAAPAIQLPGLEIIPVDLYEAERANFDLALWVGTEGAAVRVEMHYNTDLFEGATLRRLLGHLTSLLGAAMAEPRRSLIELPLLTAAERDQVAGEWIDGGWRPAVGEPALVCRLIASQAVRTPEAAALVHGEEVVTYGELERRAGLVARRLHGLGVGPESIVGLCIPRRPEMVLGLLGILTAGAAYLPLDPDLPAERLAFLLGDAWVAALLVTEPLPAGLADFAGPVIRLDGPLTDLEEDRDPLPEPDLDNLAYIIYTSGSTGRPKGVQVTQGSLARFALAVQTTYGIEPGDRILQFASLSFDNSIEEIFPALVAGATLVLRNATMMASPAEFFATCRDWQITVLDLPTAYWHTLAAELPRDPGSLPAAVRAVAMGGERPLPERVLGWLAAVGPYPRLLNTYGPTEATVMAANGTLGRPGDPPVTATAVPLGRPWGGARIWLLDPGLSLVPQGVAGELHIAGPSLSRGYLGRPDLTAAHFIPCLFGEPGERLYRTGDLALYRADGTLEFVGRVDDQVKIRGFRIEPGEIAAVLSGHPEVREAAVVAREAAAGDWRLIAYVVARREPGPAPGNLRDFLKARLPVYMVPADYVSLLALPMTTTGKLDRAALPRLEAAHDEDRYVPPQTDTEALLIQIWQEVLQRERIGVDDNLFDLGGHSLLLPQLVARIEKVIQLEIPLRVLFEAPTVAQLAVVVEEAILAQIEGLSDEEAAASLGGELEGEPAETVWTSEEA